MNNIDFAIEFATKKFDEVSIKNHFLDVFSILKNEFEIIDENILIAGILHDTLEDTNTSLDELKNVFNVEIANLVQEISHPKNYNDQQRVEYYQKLKIISDSAKLIKLADFASHLRNFVKIYERKEQHLYPKFVNNDKYVKSIDDFLESCADTRAKIIVSDLNKKLDGLL
ncbi:MAG TPA: HD domain-containing protein [Candidatus Paceibacterota bacterium]|nr:HD domain-containing protein [Candidatus Paceibacterota bacterium]HMP19302.1 HD domain-containing protein [Candidatus Paceibacterota bacterium]